MMNSIKVFQYIFFVFAFFFPTTFYSQTVAIQLDKMQVLYIGVSNPITIAIENHSCNNIVLKPKLGSVQSTSDNCHYLYRIDSCNTSFESFFIGIVEPDSIIWLDTVEYRLRRVPTPKICIAACFFGLIEKDRLLGSPIVLAILEDINIDEYAQVEKYSYEIWRNDTLIFSEKDIEGNRFTDRLISEIRKSSKGDKYYFNVFAISPYDPCLSDLQSTMYIIE